MAPHPGTMGAGRRVERQGASLLRATKHGAAGQGSEAASASASTKGGKEVKAGEQSGKMIKATDWSTEKRCSVRKEHTMAAKMITDRRF